MKESLTPEKIKKRYSKGNIDKENVAELLISLIEGSDDTKIRIESIKILERINFQDENIFNILENYLISDENENIRAIAAKYIIYNFPEDGFSALRWTIQHEKSPLVLKIFFDSINRFDTPQLNFIKEDLMNWNKNYASKLGIVPHETKFFLEIEYLLAKDKQGYEIDPFWFKNFHRLSDIRNREPWLVIKNKHIEILNYNYFIWKWVKENSDIISSLYKFKYLDVYFNSIHEYNYNSNNIIEIPKTIFELRNLKKLILKRNNINYIPDSILRLTTLKELDLSYNLFNDIPQIIGKIKTLEKLNLKGNNIQKIPDEMKLFLNSLKKFKY
ncbi:MAG: hypothetical protein ACFE91_00060 [Promethearchaeota archaeon]